MAFIQMALQSQALLRTVNVNVILPCDKVTFPGMPAIDPRPMKTLYLLHGMFGSQSDWVNYTNIQRYAEEKDLCVVMPQGDNSYYVDRPEEGNNYGTFIGEELVQLTRKMFPLSDKREYTYIAGLSMGGYGALRNGLKYAETFGRICALSTADISEDLELLNEDIPFVLMKPSFVKSLLGDLEKIPESDGNIRYLAGQTAERGIKPKVYLACGSEDQLLPKSRRIKACLEELGYDLTYSETPGGHEWPFWDKHIKAFIDSLPLTANAGMNSGNVGL